MNHQWRITVFIAVALILGGCGYKAPPYYEKESQTKEHKSAL